MVLPPARAKTRSQPKQVFVAASETQSSSLSVLELILCLFGLPRLFCAATLVLALRQVHWAPGAQRWCNRAMPV